MTNTPTPEQIAAFLKILGDCAREAAENENPNLEAAFDQIAALVRRSSIRPDGLPGEEELAIALWADEPAGPETALKWDYESPKRQMKFRHWAQRLISRLTASREDV